MQKFLEPVQNLAVPSLKIQVFERKTSQSRKHNSIMVSARQGFAAKNIVFFRLGKVLNRFLEPSASYILVPQALAQTSDPSSKTLADIIKVVWNTLISPAITFLFLAATVLFIWGLVEFIMNADNDEGRSQGKRHIAWGVFGMFIMVAAGAILFLFQNFFESI